MNTQVLGISVDSVPCLQAWAESLGGIDYPLLSDFWPHGGVARKYGVLSKAGKSERAIFVIDRWGCIRYIDIHDADEQPDNEVLFEVIERIDPDSAASQPTSAEQNSDPLPQEGIVLYCTSWCPDCKRARRWLQERNLPYTELDIDRVPAASERLKSWTQGPRITPTFDIDGVRVFEFDIDALEKTVRAWLMKRK